MIKHLRRAPATRPNRTHRTLLRLEGFECRITPSGESDTVTHPPVSTNGSPINQAPQITNFTATDLGGGLYLISGQVVDESPGGLTVTFGGSVATLNGYTVTTAANGTFSFTIQLKTDGTDTGYLLATTKDAQGLPSNQASVYVHPTP